jgi:pectinacetylesterase
MSWAKPWASRAIVLGALLNTACGSSSSTPSTDASPSSEDAAIPDGSGTSGDGSSDAGAPHDGGAEVIADTGLGEPITAPSHVWTWVDFPDSYCDDGSHTGIGVSTSSATTNLLIFLNGGGACWDYETCFQFNTAEHGPFGQPELQAIVQNLDGTILDRGSTNFFRDWSFVFVPYCTGDVHSGDNIATYTGGGMSRTYYHKGHANVVAYLPRIAATFPSARKVVISGASAGGYGALYNYATMRAYWTGSKVYLVDDSGPPLETGVTNSALRDAWFASWKLDTVLVAFCGEQCRTDFSFGLSALAATYPNDRLALLSSLQDQTIRSYFGLTAAQFQTALLQMSADRLDPTSNFKYFFVTGSSHTMLANPARFTSASVPLWDWLRRDIEDDDAWASTKP